MEIPLDLLLAYALLLNLAAFIMFGLDKARAMRGTDRISEAGLFLVSLVGGAVGGILGMLVFRHKTRKVGFKAVMVIILFLNVCLYYYLVVWPPWFS